MPRSEMGIESTLQRVSELRSQLGIASSTGSGAPEQAATTSFAAMLVQSQQQALAAAGADEAGAPPGLASLPGGVPVLTVADQYRMLGITPPTMAGMPISPPPWITGAGDVGWTGSGGPIGQRMVQLAQRELGVAEDPPGSNESARIREYRTATSGAEHTPGPWCAYFVSWLAREAGAPIGAGGNGTGYVPTLEAWGKQEGRFTPFDAGRPEPGDIVIFDWEGDATSDHTGIVERVASDGTVHTIEGNSGDAVRQRSYPASTSAIRGFVRPG